MVKLQTKLQMKIHSKNVITRDGIQVMDAKYNKQFDCEINKII